MTLNFFLVPLSSPVGTATDWPIPASGKIWMPIQRTGHLERALHQAQGMHWRKYQSLTIKHDAHVGISLNIMQQRMRMIEARLGGIGEDMNLFRKIEG